MQNTTCHEFQCPWSGRPLQRHIFTSCNAGPVYKMYIAYYFICPNIFRGGCTNTGDSWTEGLTMHATVLTLWLIKKCLYRSSSVGFQFSLRLKLILITYVKQWFIMPIICVKRKIQVSFGSGPCKFTWGFPLFRFIERESMSINSCHQCHCY